MVQLTNTISIKGNYNYYIFCKNIFTNSVYGFHEKLNLPVGEGQFGLWFGSLLPLPTGSWSALFIWNVVNKKYEIFIKLSVFTLLLERVLMKIGFSLLLWKEVTIFIKNEWYYIVEYLNQTYRWVVILNVNHRKFNFFKLFFWFRWYWWIKLFGSVHLDTLIILECLNCLSLKTHCYRTDEIIRSQNIFIKHLESDSRIFTW